MDTKAKIIVIKKDTQPEFKISKSSRAIKTKTAQQSAREMVSTVSIWVNDFQQKRREETKEAFNLLFEAQNPNNCANC